MKSTIKALLFTIMAIVMLPITLCYFLLASIFDKSALLASFSQLLSLLPGKLGCYLRAGFYRFTLTNYSPNAVVSFGTLFSQQDTSIEENVYIGPQCNIGKCTIEKNCLLGSGVHILSGKNQHNFNDLNVPIKDQGGCFEKITVGENSWLGNGAIVMANIGNNCVVAAGAVVINDVPDNAIVGGNPAKIIRIRE